MNTEIKIAQADPLLSFCKECTRKYDGKWPVSNHNLASDFVDYFKIGFFPQMKELNQLCLTANIELSIEPLPDDLLAFNYLSNGIRKIVINASPENHLIEVHTAFHEIRELIEYIFCDLGFPIVDSNDKEKCADEFASAVLLHASIGTFKEWFESAAEIQPIWKKLGALGLIGISGIAVVFHSFYCAVYPRVQSHYADSHLK